MKKFLILFVLAVILFVIFYSYITSPALEHPLGIVRLMALMIIGAVGLLALWGAYLHAPRALQDAKICMYRRHRRREKRQRKAENRLGTTTTVLS